MTILSFQNVLIGSILSICKTILTFLVFIFYLNLKFLFPSIHLTQLLLTQLNFFWKLFHSIYLPKKTYHEHKFSHSCSSEMIKWCSLFIQTQRLLFDVCLPAFYWRQTNSNLLESKCMGSFIEIDWLSSFDWTFKIEMERMNIDSSVSLCLCF